MSARRFTAFSSPRLMQSTSMAEEKRRGERGPPFPLLRDYDNWHPHVTSLVSPRVCLSACPPRGISLANRSVRNRKLGILRKAHYACAWVETPERPERRSVPGPWPILVYGGPLRPAGPGPSIHPTLLEFRPFLPRFFLSPSFRLSCSHVRRQVGHIVDTHLEDADGWASYRVQGRCAADGTGQDRGQICDPTRRTRREKQSRGASQPARESWRGPRFRNGEIATSHLSLFLFSFSLFLSACSLSLLISLLSRCTCTTRSHHALTPPAALAKNRDRRCSYRPGTTQP